MEDFYEDFNPFYESNDYLMSDPEEDEPAPEPEPEPEAPEEEPSEPEPEAPEEVPSEPEPEEPAPEPEAPEEITGEPEPEAPATEETEGGSETMKDLIDAIGGLNETIIGAVTQEPEQLPAELEEGGAGGGSGGEVQVTESASVDLTPVVQVLERNEKLLTRTNELLEQQSEIMTTQHNDLLQLQANVDFVFLAVAALIGVVLGVAVGRVFHDLWRA